MLGRSKLENTHFWLLGKHCRDGPYIHFYFWKKKIFGTNWKCFRERPFIHSYFWKDFWNNLKIFQEEALHSLWFLKIFLEASENIAEKGLKVTCVPEKISENITGSPYILFVSSFFEYHIRSYWFFESIMLEHTLSIIWIILHLWSSGNILAGCIFNLCQSYFQRVIMYIFICIFEDVMNVYLSRNLRGWQGERVWPFMQLWKLLRKWIK